MVTDLQSPMAELVVVGEQHKSNRDLDGFAAALSGYLAHAVIRANGIDELPAVPPACLMLSTGISAQASLEAAESKFGSGILARCIPVGVSSHGAELAIMQWGTLAAIDFWGFACWSVGRTGDNGATGLIVRETFVERLGLSARHRYAGLVEAADTEDLVVQTGRMIGLILDGAGAYRPAES